MIPVAVKILTSVLSKCLAFLSSFVKMVVMNLCNGFGGIIHPILRGKKRNSKKMGKLGEKSVAGKDGLGWRQMDSEQGNL